MDKEKFYDDEIAPALAAIAKRCEDAGLSFAASVEWERGESGSTVSLQENSGFSTRMAAVASRCNHNADTLIWAIMDYGRKHGHSSISLMQLGVPFQPADAAERSDV